MRGRQRQERRVPAILAVACALLLSSLRVDVREAASGVKAPDGGSCTAPAQCQSGFCADGVCCDSACNAPSSCSACSMAAGATADGTCTLLDGTPCDDGNPCTQVDTCMAGACVGTEPVVCPAPDLCTEAYCDPTADGGACATTPAPDGTPCDDHDVCTQTDTCQGGVCMGTDPVVCPLQADCQTPGLCDPVTGCSTKSAPVCGPADAGAPPAPSADGAACAAATGCASGFCVAGICCDSACTAKCHSCALPGAVGTCTEEPEGVDLGHECGAEGTCLLTCGPGGECISSGPGTECEPPRCIDDHRGLGPARCTSYGAPCPTEASVPFDCSPYLCVEALGACAPRECRSIHDCAPGYVCFEGHHCDLPPPAAGGSDCRFAPGPGPGGAAGLWVLAAGAALGLRRRRDGGGRRR
jgi:MYXO-CTERM domain-containing protein